MADVVYGLAQAHSRNGVWMKRSALPLVRGRAGANANVPATGLLEGAGEVFGAIGPAV